MTRSTTPSRSTTRSSTSVTSSRFWDRHCLGCHQLYTPHLTDDESTAGLAGTTYQKCREGVERAAFVVPGDPDASFLVFKLTGEDPGGCWTNQACRHLMPDGWSEERETPLITIDPAAVAVVRRWIEEGASFD